MGFLKRCKQLRIKYVITTEKDAVRLPIFRTEEVPLPILFLRVEIRMHDEDAFQHALDQIITTYH